jgi:hypothetical protein
MTTISEVKTNPYIRIVPPFLNLKIKCNVRKKIIERKKTKGG